MRERLRKFCMLGATRIVCRCVCSSLARSLKRRGAVGDLLVRVQLVTPSRADRSKPATDADRAEVALIDTLGDRVRAKTAGSKKTRGLIAEYQAAKAQVLEYHAQLLRCVSFCESCVNLACWVQPAKTLVVLAAFAASAAAALLVPISYVLVAATLSFFWDAWLKHERSLGKRGAKAVDERVANFVRSVPDAADLAAFFAPATRKFLDRSPGGKRADAARLQKFVERFASVVFKTSGNWIKVWQRRYVVVSDDRRLYWWATSADVDDDLPPKGARYLAPARDQRRCQSEDAGDAPRGAPKLDLVVPYLASDSFGGTPVLHFLCATDDDEAVALRLALAGADAPPPPSLPSTPRSPTSLPAETPR